MEPRNHRPSLRLADAKKNLAESIAVSIPAPDRDLEVRVLLVEDEFLIRMIVADHLRDAGFNVTEAVNGEEAVAILTAGASIDVVFSDVRMPGATDGLALLAFVRRTLPELPVFITSGHLEPALALAAGARRFIAKPYDLDEVAEALRTPTAQLR